MDQGQWSGVSQEKGWQRMGSGRGLAKAFCTSCKAVLWVRGGLRDARAWNSDGWMDMGEARTRHVAKGRDRNARDQRLKRRLYSQSMLKTPSI